jgi:hypothetical protein
MGQRRAYSTAETRERLAEARYTLNFLEEGFGVQPRTVIETNLVRLIYLASSLLRQIQAS